LGSRERDDARGSRHHPVAFRLTACDEGRLVFENPTHDFPRRVEYRRVDATRLAVDVSDGAGRGFRLDFRRQPAS
jgi:hypothetical protein